ncbi:MAG: hypothetical protein R6V50_07075 [Thermoplasmatota archaeon]
MEKKLKGLLVCMLVIVTVIPSIGAVTIPNTWSMKEYINSRSYDTAPDISQGRLITIRIRAEVLEVNDGYNCLEGSIKVGDIITGKYTYHSGTPDSMPDDPNRGVYIMTDTTCGVEFKAGGLVFKTDSNDPVTIVKVFNDAKFNDDLFDAIEFESQIDFPLSKPGWYNFIQLWFDDPTATALSSIELPTRAPVLRNWKENAMAIYGFKPGYYSTHYFYVVAWITLAIKSEVNLQGFTTTPRTLLEIIQNTVPQALLQFYLILCERFPKAFPVLQRFISK